MVFENEIVKYYDEIYRFCYHHVGSRQIAEDLCQDTFISFIENTSSRGFLQNTKSYLYTIAKNKCIDFYRKKKPVYMEELEEKLDEQSDADFTQIEVHELLSHLDEELREVLILRFFQDLKFREIADVMDISVSKAKFLVGKALDTLQKEVEL